jgi:ribosome recycling factor
VIIDALKDAQERMTASIQALEDDLAKIRTGRASPALIEKLPVDYYGQPTPLMQLANISVPEPRLLLIRPYDQTSLKNIERAILTSDLGLTPNNDGQAIRLSIPALTEERRRELVRVVHNRVEEARISVRNVRRDGIKDMREFEQEKIISKDDLKRGEDQMQKLIDDIIEKINQISDRKEKEVMEV